MEKGALGDPREAVLDTLYAEAKQVLSQTANQLHTLTERLREAHAFDVEAWQQRSEHDGSTREGTVELARGRQLLTRLELALRDLEETWLFLERGGGTERDTGARPELEETLRRPAVQHLARQVLEAQEAERTRIAEELHDGPAQALANAAFQVEIIDRSLRDDPVAAMVELQVLRRLMDRELDRLRGFIHQLRPPLLEESGLESALEELAERLTAETGIPVDVGLDAPASTLDGAHRSAVLRVAQEAFRNARKHATATRVWLTTRLERSSTSESGVGWVLEVRDDGRGFDVEEATMLTGRRHFGLRFMRERAQLVGARLEITSTPTLGTTVRLAIDLGERT